MLPQWREGTVAARDGEAERRVGEAVLAKPVGWVRLQKACETPACVSLLVRRILYVALVYDRCVFFAFWCGWFFFIVRSLGLLCVFFSKLCDCACAFEAASCFIRVASLRIALARATSLFQYKSSAASPRILTVATIFHRKKPRLLFRFRLVGSNLI